MSRVLFIILSIFAINAGPIDCVANKIVSPSIFGSSVGRAKTYSAAYSQAMSDVPFKGSVYQSHTHKPATDHEYWIVTLMWKINQ